MLTLSNRIKKGNTSYQMKSMENLAGFQMKRNWQFGGVLNTVNGQLAPWMILEQILED